MGERKVLNKYYPPDFDPAKLPKLELTKDRQYVVRLMAPFTMRCLTCGNYVYKGKKFNSRKETSVGEKYLGIQIYRFYIRCPQCLSEISFKTDPKNTDYVIDNGAYRTFQAERIAEMEEERVVQEREEDEANNPMLALENRTKESRMEMDVLDALEEIRDFNDRNAQVKFEDLMEKHLDVECKLAEEIEKQDKELASKVFEKHTIKRLRDEEENATKLLAGADIDLIATKKKKKRTDESDKSLLKDNLTSMIVRRKIKPLTTSSAKALNHESMSASSGTNSDIHPVSNSEKASDSQPVGPSSMNSLLLLNSYSSNEEDSDSS